MVLSKSVDHRSKEILLTPTDAEFILRGHHLVALEPFVVQINSCDMSREFPCVGIESRECPTAAGILKYNEALASKIDAQIEIPKHSIEENEIRANTIWAVELIKEKLKDKIPGIDSIHINDYLWVLSQYKKEQDSPYHLTRTTAY